MMLLSLNAMFPYFTLSMLIIGLFFIQSRKILTLLMAIPILVALIHGMINPIGLLSVGIFWGLCEFHWRYPFQKEWLNSIRLFLVVVFALGFANHFVPGFQNLKVFEGVRISELSSPFTMYLNFDKAIAAVILAIAGGIVFKQTDSLRKKTLVETLKVSFLGVMLLMSLATLSGYVAFDPKLPETFWLWAFNNLIFVCFAEEVIFRGVIQNHLMQVARRYQISPFVPILVTSILFGTVLLGHLHGGPAYITFATISGLFYGYAYHTTRRLEAAILVHFLVNLCHFLFFSYPMSATMAASLVK